MSFNQLGALPDDARLWCFGADRDLSPEETRVLIDRVGRFLGGWKAHARELRVGFDWHEGRFLFIAVDERQAAASGCSIDALVGQLREIESEIGVSLIDGAAVWFRDRSGVVRTVSRSDFKDLATAGAVGPDTSVFDLTVGTVRQLREGRFELPARKSWHARLLGRDRARSHS
jgi:hypothetical protein